MGRVLMTIAIALTVSLPARVAWGEELDVSVWTDRQTYYVGQTIQVGIEAYNPNPYDVTLYFGSTLQAQYMMDDSYVSPRGGFAIGTERRIPATDSYTWIYHHAWYDYDLNVGSHSLAGRVLDLDFQPGAAFDVVQPVLPDRNFTMDFETLPDGSEPVHARVYNDYAAWGVYFRSISSSPYPTPSRATNNDNSYVKISSCSYPPGFNIVADFQMPVYGVRADVTCAEGRAVTMVAKDADGNVLGSIVSDPIPGHQIFVDRLELNSQTPIASVEWWPSEEISSVGVDNLVVFVTGPHMRGDLNDDGWVGQTDLDMVLAEWGNFPPDDPRTDPSGDRVVKREDLDYVLADWGRGTPPLTPIPEPATLGVFALCGFSLLRRKPKS